MVFKVTVDATKAISKLNSLGRDIKVLAGETVSTLAEQGKQHAKSIAPYGTGYTARLIRVVKRQGSEGLKAEVQSPNPTANDGHPRNIPKFNLVLWMHTSPNAQRHNFSNDRTYMFSTRDYLTKEKRKVASAKFAKIGTKYK